MTVWRQPAGVGSLDPEEADVADPQADDLGMACPQNSVAHQWRAHRRRAVGMPVLELITTGRNSGEPRSVLLTYLDQNDGFVVIASNAGHATDPAWWLNLEASPEATVRIRGRSVAIVAREAEGAEREALWQRAVAINADYAEYALAAGRSIPVVVLDPAA